MSQLANRAFFAFTAALGISGFTLFAAVGQPFAPAIPIVLYSAYLWLNRDAIEGTGGEVLRDSPYFLGFLLTMFALLLIFQDASVGGGAIAKSPGLFTKEVGSAILTTVVGLFCRQALQTLIPSAQVDEGGERLERVAAALASHAVQLERARQEFISTVAAEADRREAVFADEQHRFRAELRRDADAMIRAATTSAVQPVFTAPSAVLASVGTGHE